MKRLFIVLILLSVLLTACGPAGAPAATVAAPPPVEISPTPAALFSATADAPLPTSTYLPAGKMQDPVNVTAFCTLIGRDPITRLKPDTPLIITWGWEAKTEMQVYDFMQANITTVTLDGNPIQGIQKEGLQKNQKSGHPEILWYAKVGVLPPGEHAITYDVRWTRMIDDGSNTYGPGGKIESTHDECKIIVE